MGRPIDVPALVEGVLKGDRRAVARAITLVESHRGDHRERAQELLVELLPHTGGARRVGISGVPGVGKSTFIDQLGVTLTAAGSRVAVLAVDPSSARSGGSILGDKTRMARLSVDPNAFIRPSPTSGTLGGVAQATRESMVVVEAAGPSALFTAMTSAISRIPRLIPCSWSPVRASVRNRNESTISATAISDCPTPTVSTRTTS